MHALELDGLARRFEGAAAAAVDGVSLQVETGSFVTLLGPSGSGKTTTLMMVAGFEQPSAGRILMAGADVTTTAPAQRNIGMVFQTYALFPHMTVRENVAFPLRVRRQAGPDAERRIDAALELVQMAAFGGRLPGQLSGGQQQRVAFARAVVFRPGLLLMDEPLSALDRRLRMQMQIELKTLQRKLGITVVYVTHDQEEALALSDRIVIMDRGRIAQEGTPADLYRRPCNAFVAGFLGSANFLHGEAVGGRVVVCGQAVRLPEGAAGAWTVCLRPEDVVVGPAGPGSFGGVLTQSVYLGEVTQLQVLLESGAEMVARVRGVPPAPVGARVSVSFAAADAILLPRDGTGAGLVG